LRVEHAFLERNIDLGLHWTRRLYVRGKKTHPRFWLWDVSKGAIYFRADLTIMTRVACQSRPAPAAACGDGAGERRFRVGGAAACGKARVRHVDGRVFVRKRTKAGRRAWQHLTGRLVAVLPTYFPSRGPFPKPAQLLYFVVQPRNNILDEGMSITKM